MHNAGVQQLEEEVVQLRNRLRLLEDELAKSQNVEQKDVDVNTLLLEVFNSSKEGTIILDLQCKILMCNIAAGCIVRSYYDKELKTGKPFNEYFYDLEEVDSKIELCKKGIYTFYEHKFNRDKCYKISFSPVFGSLADKEVVAITVLFSNISQQKEAETQLSLARFSIENASEPMYWIGPDADIIYANKCACDLLNYSSEELSKLKVYDIDYNIKQDYWKEVWENIKTKKRLSLESVQISKDKRQIPIEVVVNYIEFNGHEFHFVICKDLSDLKKSEQEVRERDALYKEIVENAPEAIVIMDFEKQRFFDCNENAERLYKLDKESILKLHPADLSPEFQPDGSSSYEKSIYYINQAIAGERPVFEWMHKDSLGNPILCEVRISLISYKGKVMGRASIVDIINRKYQEAILQESEQKYRSLFELNPDGVFSLDKEGYFKDGNEALANLAQMPLNEIINNSFFPLVAPEDFDLAFEHFLKAWSGVSETFEIDIITGKGNRRSVSITSIPILVNYQILEVYGTVKDMTESKNYTLYIQKAAKQLKSIYESITDSFFTLDKEWNFIIVNKEFEKLVKINRYKLLGNNFWKMIPSTQGSSYEHYFKVAMETGEAIKYELFDETTKKQLEVSVFPSQVGLSIYIRDITEKKQAELEIKNSLHEKEILLAEIHHRVKNNMAVISSLLQLQAYSVDDDKIRSVLKESKNRIQSISLVHEKLYQSETLSRIQMGGYIKQLLDHLNIAYESNLPIRFHVRSEDVEVDITKAVPCGLILNELISNIFKHAFKGKPEGDIWINFYKTNKGFELEVRDNGVGFPADFDATRQGSMGVVLVQMLTEQLNGTISIENQDGAAIRIAFPKL